MKDVLKRVKGEILIVFLLSIIALFTSITGYADEKQAATTQEQKEEIFIGQFKGDISAKWCGNNALVVSEREYGIEWIDILNKKTIKISSRTFPDDYDYPLNCTPDGKWVVYVDSKSLRADKGYKPPNPKDCDDWGVVDLYRYDVTTGKKQKFAVIRAPGCLYEAVSPDGMKILLGERHNSIIKMPNPKWNTVWKPVNAIWFLDSSGIAWINFKNTVAVEFFGKNGWAKKFELKQFEYKTFSLAVDKANRIYLYGVEKGKEKEALYRCSIKNKNLSCEKILERISDYKVLPNGDIVSSDRTGCISHITVGQVDRKCIVEKGGDYDFIRIGAVSPDGQRLAFVRQKVGKMERGGHMITQSALFVINLVN
jgi:hypothetical protein